FAALGRNGLRIAHDAQDLIVSWVLFDIKGETYFMMGLLPFSVEPSCCISSQQLAIHASRRVKLAKKVHYTGRRESDFHRHFSLSRDIYVQVLIRDAEIVLRTRLVLDFHLELLSGRPPEKGGREVIVIGL